MNKEKEIEEMAKVLKKAIVYDKHAALTYGYTSIYYALTAENLINAGIGNVKQAVKEFAELLDNKAQDLNGDSWDEYNEGFKRGVEETLFLVYDLITELYGG